MSGAATPRPPNFLRSIYPDGFDHKAAGKPRPYVTLTYAQSIDGCIAGKGGTQILLSGKESMVMTHWMRTLHDGILVGSNTLRNDNPQLNIGLSSFMITTIARHLPPASTTTPHRQPRPIILDTNLRTPADCKLLQNYAKGVGQQPWIVCGRRKTFGHSSSPTEALRENRRDDLEAAGAKIIEVAMDEKKLVVDLKEALAALKNLGLKSLMVEGGATVIATFLDLRDADDGEPTVDMHVVTVAPIFIGPDGMQAAAMISKVPQMEPIAAEVFGKDAVFASRLRGNKS